ncbi:MAG: hypothetical protein LKK21_11085 [Prevotella sp.]|jgi:hypothetical protein|nr:hypothetical protein [Prevotella sp.]MCI2088697.1 hypothetical protein [Prevotella sp.]MCI2126165.1 hypothetical protein [Prevotella sp.]
MINNKVFLFLIFTILVDSACMAQTSFQEIEACPCKTGGVYFAYKNPTVNLSPAPSGYFPFYISHYGRHGSRYLISDQDYKNVLDIFIKANNAKVLTQLGGKVLKDLKDLWQEVEGHGGDLSIIGRDQERGIAERMVHNFPTLFSGDKMISARSTLSFRCAMSMVAFGDRLKELNPYLHIYYEASNKYMKYLNYHTDSSNTFTNNNTGPWVEEYKKFESEHLHPKRLLYSLFNDSI